MARGFLLLAAGLDLAAPLCAAPLTVRVADAFGRSVRDAVVTLCPARAAARSPQRSPSFQPPVRPQRAMPMTDY